METIKFIASNASECGYTAKATNYPIHTEGSSLENLKDNIDDAVKCHFGADYVHYAIELQFDGPQTIFL